MEDILDPVLVKDLKDAKAALARHGIVILRTVQTELEPAVMVKVRDAMASSPGKLKRMTDEELDKFMEKIRKTASKSADDLADLHTHLLTRLGTEYIVDLVKELEGINQIFQWERIAKTTEPVNVLLASKGFTRVELDGPEEVSDAFAMELTERWPKAFDRFRTLARDAADRLKDEPAAEERKTEKKTASKKKKSKKKR